MAAPTLTPPPQVHALIAARDEASAIPGIVTRLRSLGLPVLVVAGDCSDDTAALARDAGATVLEINRPGKGRAVRAGWQHLLDHPGWDWILMLDGDGQHDPGHASALIAAAAEASTSSDPPLMIIGSRHPFATPMPPRRRLANRFMSAVLSWRCRLDLPDSQCGFRLLHRDLVAGGRWTARHFEIESEMALETARLGGAVRTVPIPCAYRGETSAIRPVLDSWRWFRWLAVAARP